jgi:hypothetical protein
MPSLNSESDSTGTHAGSLAPSTLADILEHLPTGYRSENSIEPLLSTGAVTVWLGKEQGVSALIMHGEKWVGEIPEGTMEWHTIKFSSTEGAESASENRESTNDDKLNSIITHLQEAHEQAGEHTKPHLKIAGSLFQAMESAGQFMDIFDGYVAQGKSCTDWGSEHDTLRAVIDQAAKSELDGHVLKPLLAMEDIETFVKIAVACGPPENCSVSGWRFILGECWDEIRRESYRQCTK